MPTDEEETLRRRAGAGDSAAPPPSTSSATAAAGGGAGTATSRRRPVGVSSEESDFDGVMNEEKYGEKLERLTKDIPQDSGSLGTVMDSLLAGLPPRWRNWVVRGVFSLIMISLFSYIVSRGAMALMILVLLIQFKCFHEIINIGLAVYRLYDLPLFRTLSWYFLLSSNYFFFGENLIDKWSILLRRDNFAWWLVAYHRLISFSLYCFGFVWFVLSLRKGYYMRQFSLFAWSHVALLLIVSQSFLIIQNIFQGTIWFLVPVAMVICCDIMSYVFGFFWGKTPLIKLSPKKTWEGFIGGAFSTVIFGILLSYVLISSPFFVCPLDESTLDSGDNWNCTIPSSFQLRNFNLPRPFSWIQPSVQIYPFLLHSIVLSLFASILGPFGGFFASGFKRAFRIKDFGAVIPGHGGLMDRFDCQLLMGTFVHVYVHTFIRSPSANKLLAQLAYLPRAEQLEVHQKLGEWLLATTEAP